MMGCHMDFNLLLWIMLRKIFWEIKKLKTWVKMLLRTRSLIMMGSPDLLCAIKEESEGQWDFLFGAMELQIIGFRGKFGEQPSKIKFIIRDTNSIKKKITRRLGKREYI